MFVFSQCSGSGCYIFDTQHSHNNQLVLSAKQLRTSKLHIDTQYLLSFGHKHKRKKNWKRCFRFECLNATAKNDRDRLDHVKKRFSIVSFAAKNKLWPTHTTFFLLIINCWFIFTYSLCFYVCHVQRLAQNWTFFWLLKAYRKYNVCSLLSSFISFRFAFTLTGLYVYVCGGLGCM